MEQRPICRADSVSLDIALGLAMTISEGLSDKTLIHVAGSPCQSSADEIAAFRACHACMTQGCNGSFAQLGDYLAQLSRP